MPLDRLPISRRGSLGSLAAAGMGSRWAENPLDAAAAPSADLPRLAGRRRLLFGAWEPGPSDAIDALEKRLGRKLDIVHWFQGWGAEDPAFDLARARRTAARGAIPMVTWEPWDYRQGKVQPRFQLRHIAAGRFDKYIRSWAHSLRDFGEPIWLRFAHEMNGPAYPWSVGVNHNTAADYVRAWRHVVDLMRKAGADNVSFVWCPVVPSPGAAPLARCFPGDRWVDLVGMDGYNAGTAADWGGWLSFSAVFGNLYKRVRNLSARPVIIAETGCAEQGGSKPTWIRHAFLRQLPTHFPAVRAVVWYDEHREANWRLDSTAEAMRSARSVFTSAPYV